MTNRKIDRKTFGSALQHISVKSHNMDDLYEAYLRGEGIYILDSGASGNDDILCGSYEECIDSLISFFEWHDWDWSLPMGWSLVPLSDYIS